MNITERETEIHQIFKAQLNCFYDVNNVKLLTSREDWSDVTDDEAEKIVTPELIERLKFSGDEEGYICKKDGKIGVWLELEFPTCHSDEHEGTLSDVFGDAEIPTTPQQIVQCGLDAIWLQHQHPEAEFFVTEGSGNWSNRVCLCAFIPENVENREQIFKDFNYQSRTKVGPDVVRQVFGDKLNELTSYFEARKEAFLASQSGLTL